MFPSDFANEFRHDDGLQARPVMANPEPFNIRADRIMARLNPPVFDVNGLALLGEIPGDIPLQVLVEKQFDIVTLFAPISLQADHINRLLSIICWQILRWHPIASMVTITPLNSSSASISGMAVISLDLSATLRCPRTSFWPQAKAEAILMTDDSLDGAGIE